MVVKENLPPSVFIESFKILNENENKMYINTEKIPEYKVVDDIVTPFKNKFNSDFNISRKQKSYQRIVQNGTNEEKTPLKYLYYSQTNVDVLQKLIKYSVKKASGYIISDQNVTELLQIMKLMDLWYSSNTLDKNKYVDEIMKLNQYVVNRSVPSIISAINSHKLYLRDINQPRNVILERPAFSTSKGDGKMMDSINVMI